MNGRVAVEMSEGVAEVRLNRPDKLNALDAAMFSDLIAAGRRLAEEPQARAVVLSAEGRAFCAGLDMGSFAEMASGARAPGSSSAGGDLLSPERTPSGANRAQNAGFVWRDLPVPVIAAVHGVAFGGGLQIALGADLRFVSPDARLSIREIVWGLVPDMGGMAILPRLLRDDVLRELCYSGREVAGEEAVRIGLATRLCEDPRAEALAFARDLAGRSPDALRAAKRLLALGAGAPTPEVLLAESVEQAALIGSPNQVEAVRANLEKRAPRFRDPPVPSRA